MDLLKAEIEKKRKQLEDANLLVSNGLEHIDLWWSAEVKSNILTFVSCLLCPYRIPIENILKDLIYCQKNEKNI